MALAPYYREFELPWEGDPESSTRFRRILRILLVLLVISLVSTEPRDAAERLRLRATHFQAAAETFQRWGAPEPPLRL